MGISKEIEVTMISIDEGMILKIKATIALQYHRGGSRGRVQGVCTPPLEMTCGFLIQLVFCKKKTMWFIGVEVEQETIAPPPKKNPGSAPVSIKFDAISWTMTAKNPAKKCAALLE